MDPFKIGLRNLIGITAPGAIVFLALVLGLSTASIVVDPSASPMSMLKDTQWFVIVGAFLLSYLLGSLFRLNSADDVDALSSSKLERDFQQQWPRPDLDRFLEVRGKILDSHGILSDAPAGFDRWLWTTEIFPYPAWTMRKLRLYHPPEMAEFFRPYHEGLKQSRKDFLNYCKMVVATRGKNQEDALIQEVQAAEANVRFFAGTYFALESSAGLLAIIQLWLVGVVCVPHAYPAAAVSISLGAVLVYGLWRHLPLRAKPITYGRPTNAKGEHESTEEDDKTAFDNRLNGRNSQYRAHAVAWFTIYCVYALAGSWLLCYLVWATNVADVKVALEARASSALLAALAVIGLMDYGCRLIVSRFRLLRIKEVDVVLHAFYLAQKSPPS